MSDETQKKDCNMSSNHIQNLVDSFVEFKKTIPRDAGHDDRMLLCYIGGAIAELRSAE